MRGLAMALSIASLFMTVVAGQSGIPHLQINFATLSILATIWAVGEKS